MGNTGSSSISISRCKRDLPPAHYLMRIKPYSIITGSMLTRPEFKFDSGLFESGGHKWKLSLYPNGKGTSENNYISLYLSIEETGTYPAGWEVFANFKLFVYDQVRDNYLTIHDPIASVNRFSEMKKEWGFQELIALETFHNHCNGYLVDDCCVFGAEVCVIERTYKVESLSIVKEPVSMVKETPSVVKEPFSMVKDPVSKAVSKVKAPVSKAVSMVKEPVSKAVSMLKEPVSKAVSMMKEPVSKPVSMAKEPVSKPVSKPVCRPVSVVKEPLSMVKEPVYKVNVITWKLEKFSTLHNYAYESNVFRVGGRNWTLKVYPKGDSRDGLWLSVFLHLVDDWQSSVPISANFKLQILDNAGNIKKDESSGTCRFRAGGLGCGFSKFMKLKDLNEFIVNDTLTIQAQFVNLYTPPDRYIQAITSVGLTAVMFRRRLVDALIVVGDWVSFNDWSLEGFVSGMEKFAQGMEQFGQAMEQFGAGMQEIAEGVEMLKDCTNPERKGSRERLPECKCLCLESKCCLTCRRKGVAGCKCSRSQSKCCGKGCHRCCDKSCRIHFIIDV